MPEKKYRYVSFLITPELETALRAASEDMDRSASWIIKEALAEYLKLKEPRSKPKSRKKPASH
jgi:predicted transcriptional regulator